MEPNHRWLWCNVSDGFALILVRFSVNHGFHLENSASKKDVKFYFEISKRSTPGGGGRELWSELCSICPPSGGGVILPFSPAFCFCCINTLPSPLQLLGAREGRAAVKCPLTVSARSPFQIRGCGAHRHPCGDAPPAQGIKLGLVLYRGIQDPPPPGQSGVRTPL